MTGIIADNLALAQIPFLERTVDSPGGSRPALYSSLPYSKKKRNSMQTTGVMTPAAKL